MTRDRERREQLPAIVPSAIEEIESSGTEPPDWLHTAATIPLPERVGNPFQRYSRPLFEPKYQRAIITRLASVRSAAGEVDIERVIDEIARGQPLRRIPRRAIPTATKGLQLLVDQAESMEPFRQDVAELTRSFRRTIGASRVTVYSFRHVPVWGCDFGVDSVDYRFPPPGVPVVIVSDLGAFPQPPASLNAEPLLWAAFLKRLSDLRHCCSLVVPRNSAEIPGMYRRHAQVIAWDRTTRVSSLLQAQGAARDESEATADSTELSKGASELARLASLASRIEPQLLRALRLHLTPDVPVSAEAELWFSDLIETRAPTGIVLSATHRERLQTRLADDENTVRRAFAVIQDMHMDAAPALRMEEELAYRWLLQEDSSVRALLQRFVATVISPDRPEASKWAARAVLRLPSGLAQLEEMQMLALGAALRTGEISTSHLPAGVGGGDWRWLRPPSKESAIGINLREGMLEFVPRSARAAHTLRTPDMNPVVVEILYSDSPAVHRVLIDPSSHTTVAVRGNMLQLNVPGAGCWHLYRITESERLFARLRAPRVHIEYDVETYGGIKQVQLPFIVGVLADFSGRTQLAELESRKFIEIDIDSFDDRMRRFRPRVMFAVPLAEHSLAIDLTFGSMDDFAPENVAAQVPVLADLVVRRSRAAGDVPIEEHIASVDSELGTLLNAILHHPDFQQIEATWRGLYRLVSSTETNEMLKIKIFAVSKAELSEQMASFAGERLFENPLFRVMHDVEFGQLGGEPFGCFVGDFEFDHSPNDVRLLREMSRICAIAHAPFIAAAAPSLLAIDSWQSLMPTQEISKTITSSEHAAWRELRQTDDARYIGLTMPRFLARLPYGSKTNPVEAFAFEEDTANGDSSRYTWSNSAYAMAANITRAFSQFGWCARIRGVESGGSVDGLPVHAFPSEDGGVDMKCPLQIALTDRQEAELARAGLLPLVHRRNSDVAVFIGAQSLQDPPAFEDPETTANVRLIARLPYVFASSRFAHYLKCMMRDKVGSFREPTDMSRYLSDWIRNYVDGDPQTSPESVRAHRPLADAEVVIEEAGQSGPHRAVLFVQPHYQLDGLTATMRMNLLLPSEGGALAE